MDKQKRVFVWQIIFPSGIAWPVTISATHMSIGCQTHTHGKWESFTDEEISEMDRFSLAVWERHGGLLLSICKEMRDGQA